MLFKPFLQYIKENNITAPKQSVLAAVSGGADSICLLHLLVRLKDEWGLKVSCAHVNHGIRDTAQRDEDFVRGICKMWDIPFFVKRENVKAIAEEKKISEELAGRQVRYDFFNELCSLNGFDRILTAHHKGDQAETVLMHLIRGSGMHGLCGISPLRGKLGRPLLCFKRCEIEEYLKANGIKWIEDETNALSIYSRNKIRNEIFPLLNDINPEAVSAIADCADILRAEDDFMNLTAQKTGAVKCEDGCVFIDTEILNTCADAIKNRIFYYALSLSGGEVNREDIKRLRTLAEGVGRKASLSGECMAETEYGRVAIYRPQEISFCHKIEIGKQIYIPELQKTVVAVYDDTPSRRSVKVCDGDIIYVRSRRQGDRFTPEGAPGRKKLKEFFIDEKVPRRHRDSVPIITVNDKIAYVYPFRRDEEFVPRGGGRCITIHIKGEKNDEYGSLC